MFATLWIAWLLLAKPVDCLTQIEPARCGGCGDCVHSPGWTRDAPRQKPSSYG